MIRDGVLARRQCLERLVLGLHRVLPGTLIQAPLQFVFRTFEVAFRLCQFVARTGRCASFPGDRDGLPGVTHFLDRWPRSARRKQNEQRNNDAAPAYADGLVGYDSCYRYAHPVTLTPLPAAVKRRGCRQGRDFRSLPENPKRSMKLTIYHNPRCSKSRQTLALLEARGVQATVVDYLNNPPDGQTVLRLAALLGLPVSAILRPNEADYAALTADCAPDDDACLADGLADHPKALQRPIVVDEDSNRAIIGRPPENVLELLENS